MIVDQWRLGIAIAIYMVSVPDNLHHRTTIKLTSNHELTRGLIALVDLHPGKGPWQGTRVHNPLETRELEY